MLIGIPDVAVPILIDVVESILNASELSKSKLPLAEFILILPALLSIVI